MYEGQFAPLGENALQTMHDLAIKQLELQERVAKLKDQLKAVEIELERVSTIDIPDFLDEVGIQEYTTDTGVKISVKRVIRGNIKKENEAKAHHWLVENDHGDLLKRQIKIDLNRDQKEMSDEIKRSLDKLDGVRYDAKQFVHPQTLSAFVREQLEKGEDLPDEITIFEQRKSEIKFEGD